MKKISHLVLIAVLLSFGFAGVVMYLNGNSNSDVLSSNTKEISFDYSKAEEKYIKLLNSENPRAALSKLREEIKGNDMLLRSCHIITHKLGHVAYDEYKDFAQAIEYQDEICNSGYLHGVIEKHFSNSSDIFKTQQEVCAKYNPESFMGWECYHGVGHGLMYYTSNDLPRSIELCKTYKTDAKSSSCINGVFMENFNADQKLHVSKYLKKDDPFYPCQEQNKEYKRDCYLYAPSYYLALNRNEYINALKWCKSAEENYVWDCISGVGAQAMKENINNPKMVEKICMESEFHEFCVSGMVELYINHYGALEPAREMCGQLAESNSHICREAVENRTKQFNQVDPV